MLGHKEMKSKVHFRRFSMSCRRSTGNNTWNAPTGNIFYISWVIYRLSLYVFVCLNAWFCFKSYVSLFRELNRRLSKDPTFRHLSPHFKVDAKMILEFNHCLASYEGIPLEAYFNRRALLITANCAAIRRILGVPEKRMLVEKVIDNMGLEHLGHIRYVSKRSGTFTDLWGDDTDHRVNRFKW